MNCTVWRSTSTSAPCSGGFGQYDSRVGHRRISSGQVVGRTSTLSGATMTTPDGTAAAVRQVATGHALRALPRSWWPGGVAPLPGTPAVKVCSRPSESRASAVDQHPPPGAARSSRGAGRRSGPAGAEQRQRQLPRRARRVQDGRAFDAGWRQRGWARRQRRAQHGVRRGGQQAGGHGFRRHAQPARHRWAAAA